MTSTMTYLLHTCFAATTPGRQVKTAICVPSFSNYLGQFMQSSQSISLLHRGFKQKQPFGGSPLDLSLGCPRPGGVRQKHATKRSSQPLLSTFEDLCGCESRAQFAMCGFPTVLTMTVCCICRRLRAWAVARAAAPAPVARSAMRGDVILREGQDGAGPKGSGLPPGPASGVQRPGSLHDCAAGHGIVRRRQQGARTHHPQWAAPGL